MNKFISDDDKLKGEIEKMISISDLDAMRELFPEESNQVMEEGIEQGMEGGVIKTAKTMKSLGDSIQDISKRTGLSIDEIEKL